MSVFGVCTSLNVDNKPKPLPDIRVYHDPQMCARLCQENSNTECDYAMTVGKSTGHDGLETLDLSTSRVNHYISAVYNGARLDERGTPEFGGTNRYRVDFEW